MVYRAASIHSQSSRARATAGSRPPHLPVHPAPRLFYAGSVPHFPSLRTWTMTPWGRNCRSSIMSAARFSRLRAGANPSSNMARFRRCRVELPSLETIRLRSSAKSAALPSGRGASRRAPASICRIRLSIGHAHRASRWKNAIAATFSPAVAGRRRCGESLSLDGKGNNGRRNGSTIGRGFHGLPSTDFHR